jgi:hypothetical protein
MGGFNEFSGSDRNSSHDAPSSKKPDPDSKGEGSIDVTQPLPPEKSTGRTTGMSNNKTNGELITSIGENERTKEKPTDPFINEDESDPEQKKFIKPAREGKTEAKTAEPPGTDTRRNNQEGSSSTKESPSTQKVDDGT